MTEVDCKDTFHPKWLNDSIIIWSEDTEKTEPDISWMCSNGTRGEGHQWEHWNFQSYIKIFFFLIIRAAKYKDRSCRDIMAYPPLQLFRTQPDKLTWFGVLWAGNLTSWFHELWFSLNYSVILCSNTSGPISFTQVPIWTKLMKR